jgi:hypothetical protein
VTNELFRTCDRTRVETYQSRQRNICFLNTPTASYLELIEDSNVNSGTSWFFIATPQLKVAIRSGQVEVIPLKDSVKEMLFTTLNTFLSQVENSNSISLDCLVVEAVIAVFVIDSEQCIERRVQSLSFPGTKYSSSYSQLEHVQSIQTDLRSTERELQNLREKIHTMRTSLCTFHSSSAMTSSESLVRYLYQLNGMTDSFFFCLQVREIYVEYLCKVLKCNK